MHTNASDNPTQQAKPQVLNREAKQLTSLPTRTVALERLFSGEGMIVRLRGGWWRRCWDWRVGW